MRLAPWSEIIGLIPSFTLIQSRHEHRDGRQKNRRRNKRDPGMRVGSRAVMLLCCHRNRRDDC